MKMKCLAVLIALFCSACRPGTIEPFVYLPEEPVAAILKSASPVGPVAVLIKFVDGVPPKLLENQVVVTPGLHLIQIEAEYHHQKAPYELTRILRSFEFSFASGGSYLCNAKPTADGLDIWIENSSTGEVVAGEAPGSRREGSKR